MLAGRFRVRASSLRLLSGWIEPENSVEEKRDQVLESRIYMGWILFQMYLLDLRLLSWQLLGMFIFFDFIYFLFDV